MSFCRRGLFGIQESSFLRRRDKVVVHVVYNDEKNEEETKELFLSDCVN